jgi:hypothetical protein
MRIWENEDGDVLSLHVFLKEPDLTGPLSRIEEIRSGYRGSIAQSGGALVEVEADELGGLPALRTIFKFPQEPHGMSYIGAWTIPRRNCSFVIKVCCAEHGTTGVRDSVVALKLGFPQNEDDPFQGWCEDPYDPRFKSQVLRNRSDDREWDEFFPQHPLTRARACLHRVKESISIGEDVRRSKPFLGRKGQTPGKSWFSRLTG